MMITGDISAIEELRRYVIEHVMNINTMKKSWPKQRNKIIELVGDPPDPEKILDLGDHLSDIFETTKGGGRTQGSLSGGGAVWECLICWYCNICLLGSRIVIVKYKKDLIPKPLRDAITVSYGNVTATSEADLMAIIFPKRAEYTTPRASPRRKKFQESMDALASQYFKEYELGIIQCKTNWNDSAQVAMLWDMIYKMRDFPGTNIQVGTSDYSISDLEKFTYSFATVPTNKWKKYTEKQISVRRVTVLSGSNYWGHPTRSGVANSLREIFRNFRNGFTGQIVRNRELEGIRGKYAYFKLYE